MKCRLISVVCLAMFAACSSNSAVEGAILSTSHRDLDGETAKAVRVFTVAPGATQDLAVRVTWSFQVEQDESTHPFGSVDVAVERNDLGASVLTCAAEDPELSTLLNGDRLWMIALSCAFEAERQSGKDITASLWANGLLTY